MGKDKQYAESTRGIQEVLVAFFIIYVFVCVVKSEIEKDVYKEDVDRQFARMYEYNIKPLSGDKTDRLGGSYFALLEYGDLSEEKKCLLISDIKNDGFRNPYLKKNCNGKHFCKGKIAIVFLVKDTEQVRIMIVNNDYDEEKR